MGQTILGFDGFDWMTSTYTPIARSELWLSGSNAPVTGRFGGQAYHIGSVLTSVVLPITNTLAFHLGLSVANGAGVTLSLRDSASATQFEVTMNSGTRLIQLKRGGTVVATGTKPLAIGTWYSLQVHFFLHDATGRCVVKIEGQTDIDFTGDTKNTAIADISSVSFSSSANAFVDDVVFYLPDTLNVDWLPDCKVTTKTPNGAGASTQWAVTGAANNWTAAASTDGDTSYVASSTPGETDLYAMSNAAPLGQVFGVNVGLLARKDDAATRQIRAKVRIGATNYDGGTKTLTSSYLCPVHMWLNSPATAAPWGLAEVDSIQAGVEEIA
jgi:hypothetical protein